MASPVGRRTSCKLKSGSSPRGVLILHDVCLPNRMALRHSQEEDSSRFLRIAPRFGVARNARPGLPQQKKFTNPRLALLGHRLQSVLWPQVSWGTFSTSTGLTLVLRSSQVSMPIARSAFRMFALAGEFVKLLCVPRHERISLVIKERCRRPL